MVRKLDKLGCRASHTAELKFDNVRVPAENLLGGQDRLEHKLSKAREVAEMATTGARRGGSAALGTFEQTRPMVAAQALGIARAALEYVTEYANRREAFGAPIINNQGIAFPLADLATRIDAARLLTWRASWMAATGVPFERGEGSMSKLASSEVAVATTERAIQTMGVGATSAIIRWRSGTGMPSSTPSSRAPARSSGSSSPTRWAPATGPRPCTSTSSPRGPLNRWFGRGTPARTRMASAALSAKDRLPPR